MKPRNIMRGLLLTGAVLVLWILQSGVALAQCPMCKAAVEAANGKESKMVEGLNTGIIYLFILPYASLILLGVVFYLAYRKHKRARAREEMVTLEKMQGLGNLDAPTSA
jgi:cbb3-type cytochrome oxidase subunit 3